MNPIELYREEVAKRVARREREAERIDLVIHEAAEKLESEREERVKGGRPRKGQAMAIAAHERTIRQTQHGLRWE
jgi:hypothetical protein